MLCTKKMISLHVDIQKKREKKGLQLVGSNPLCNSKYLSFVLVFTFTPNRDTEIRFEARALKKNYRITPFVADANMGSHDINVGSAWLPMVSP